MPIGDNNGEQPGGDAADQNAGTVDGDAAGKKAGDESKDGDEGTGDKPVTFASQAELDRIIQGRVDRALRKANEDKALTETQKLTKERDDLQKGLLERDLKDAFVTESGLDVAKGSRIFRMYRDDIETDKDGKATNLKTVIASAKKEFPDIFGTKPGNGDGGKGSGDDGKPAGGGMNDILRQMAGKGGR